MTTLAAEWFLVTGDLLSQNLQHPVGWPDYVTIAWTTIVWQGRANDLSLVSSIAPVAASTQMQHSV